MRFLSIYKAPESTQPPSAEYMAEMTRLVEEGMRSGELLATEGCLPSAFGARVRLAGGTITVMDGPFSESKEVVGGFAILQAPSKEAAIEMARKFLKVAGGGECEIRQIFEAPTSGAPADCHAQLTEQFAGR